MTQSPSEVLTPSAALQELLSWSEELPNWQRHGLRCIAAGALSNEDIANTLEHCRLEHGLAPGEGTLSPSSSPPQFVPLTSESLPTASPTEVDAAVTLTSITQVADVNLLKAQQTLDFAPTGLTAIYGENATGKSGYARILKKACQARDPEGPLLPGLGKPPTGSPPSPRATISFAVGGKPSSIDWVDGGVTSPDLPFVRFFDSGCARVQVREDNEVTFTPLAINILQRHVELCNMVAEQLRAEKAIKEQTLPKNIAREISPKIKHPRIAQGTKAFKLLTSLSRQLNDKEAWALANVNETEQSRQTQLGQVLSHDPNQLLKSKKTRIARLREVHIHISSTSKLLSEDAIEKLKSAFTHVQQTAAAARLAADTLFKEQNLLPEVASDTWRSLWESARSYSSIAYPGKEFPVTEDAVCVLCQQPLKDKSPSRLMGFEGFISGATQSASEDAQKVLDDTTAPVRAIQFPPFTGTYSVLGEEDNELCALVRRYSVQARLRRRHVLRCIEGQHQWETSPTLLPSPEDEVKSAGLALKAEIKALEEAIGADAKARQVLVEEKSELDSRLALATLIDDVTDAIAIHSTLKNIDLAIRSAGTARASRKVTALTKSSLTNQLRTQFAIELQNIGANFTPIEFNQVGSKQGSPHFRAQLLANPDAEVARVLSEGEHTCAALAGFLAELSISTHQSGIVFDDPITSLDHVWRRKVAKRLAEEAQHRQVVVFTHDAVFLLFLREASEELGGKVRYHHLTRTKALTGIVVSDTPWIAMNVGKRFGVLKSRLQDARPIYKNGRHDDYAILIKSIYGLIRETWERAIEEVLLNGVVTRFGRSIQTQKVSVLTDITDDDYKRIAVGMGFGSGFAHDEAPAIGSSTPEPDDVAQSIRDIEEWVAIIRKRRAKKKN